MYLIMFISTQLSDSSDIDTFNELFSHITIVVFFLTRNSIQKIDKNKQVDKEKRENKNKQRTKIILNSTEKKYKKSESHEYNP